MSIVVWYPTAAGQQFEETFTGAITPSGVLATGASALKSSALTHIGNIFKTDSVPKTGALTNSGAITKLDQALTSGTLTNSGSTTLSRILSQIAAAVLTTTGALLNTIAISKTSAVTYIGATHVNHSTRIHVAVDPWDSDSYPTLMRRRTTTRLSMMADAMNLDLLILPWQDTEFFALCAAGVPFHAEPESGGGRAAPSAPGRLRSPLITTYSFVHIDAEHTVPAVSRAIDFLSRVPVSAAIGSSMTSIPIWTPPWKTVSPPSVSPPSNGVPIASVCGRINNLHMEKFNFDLIQGSTPLLRFRLLVPEDVTDWDTHLTITNKFTGNTVFEANGTISTEVTDADILGVFDIALSAADTTALTPQTHYYSFWRTNAGFEDPLVSGTVHVKKL